MAGLDRAVSPSFVGYDISCMMQFSLFDITPEEFLRDREQLAEVLRGVTSFGVGANFADGVREHSVMEDPTWNEIGFVKGLKQLAQAQLGSSGGGNHFADLVVVECLQCISRWMSKRPSSVRKMRC